MQIYKPAIITTFQDTGARIEGIWPGWDTAIPIINHLNVKTCRHVPSRWPVDEKAAADQLGEKMRKMRRAGGKSASREFYEALESMNMMPQVHDRMTSYSDVTSGEMLVRNLEAEALIRWAEGPSVVRCGNYMLEKSFLDAPRRKELKRLHEKTQRYASPGDTSRDLAERLPRQYEY